MLLGLGIEAGRGCTPDHIVSLVPTVQNIVDRTKKKSSGVFGISPVGRLEV